MYLGRPYNFSDLYQLDRVFLSGAPSPPSVLIVLSMLISFFIFICEV